MLRIKTGFDNKNIFLNWNEPLRRELILIKVINFKLIIEIENQN